MPALITPFTDAGSVDVSAHRHNVALAGDWGATGILVAGSTGEGPYLERHERGALVSHAKSVIQDMVVLCGIFAETDRQAAEQIGEATDAGADAVLVVTPTTLVRGRDRLVGDFFERTAEASPVPVFIYTVPLVTGYELPIEVITTLTQHHNIHGMKDSGGSASRIGELRDVLDDNFIVYAGASAALLESAALGAHGAITASGNYAFDVVGRAARGDRNAQAQLSAVTAAVQRYGVPGTKFAASLRGMKAGESRLPLQPLSDEAQRSVGEAVDRLDEVNLPAN